MVGVKTMEKKTPENKSELADPEKDLAGAVARIERFGKRISFVIKRHAGCHSRAELCL